MMDKSVQEIYGNRVRVRVCGLCWEGDRMLLVNHRGLYKHDFWAPPGGGSESGQSIEFNLRREFREETGLRIKVGSLQFVCEFIQPPLHAIELFFDVTAIGGRLFIGADPEMDEKEQIIHEVKYLAESEIRALPARHKHGLFKTGKTLEKVRDLKGYLKI